VATIAELCSALKTWLSEQIRIDGWSANPPTNVATVINGSPYPANTAFQGPIRDLVVLEKLNEDIIAEFTLSFAVTYRFDKSLAYHQLPVYDAEILASSVLITAITHAGCIHEDIHTITAESYDPVEVARFEQPATPEGRDWLVILYFPFKVRSILEPGLSSLQPGDSDEPPYDLEELTVGIWRSLIDELAEPESTVLDRELVLADES
jgi:hypothetical protein